jgi:hypothetical protein
MDAGEGGFVGYTNWFLGLVEILSLNADSIALSAVYRYK